jgi:hypothetical protein
MTVYLQLEECPGPIDASINYRQGFFDYVTSIADPAKDSIILIEPNPWRLSALRKQWGAWPKAEFIQCAVVGSEESRQSINLYFVAGDELDVPVMTRNQDLVRRYHPAKVLDSIVVECKTLEAIISMCNVGQRIAVLSIDPRLETDGYEKQPWGALPIDEIVVVSKDIEPKFTLRLQHALKAAGYTASGRPWGEAKTIISFAKARSLKSRFLYLARELRVAGGNVLVQISKVNPDPYRRWKLKQKILVALPGKYSSADVLDENFQIQLTTVPRYEIEEAISLVTRHPDIEWSLTADWTDSSREMARECFSKHGVWPISFSYPCLAMPLQRPQETLNSITPGFPYSFDDEAEYLNVYGRSSLAITHRKAGWDCFRHLEIMASGSVPLMLDAPLIPKYSMIHYPKIAMAEVLALALEYGGRPSQSAREGFFDFFNKHLTTLAMAEYILEMSGLSNAAKVLFIDEHTPTNPEYLSTLTLMGLKQLFGTNCEVAYPADFLYSDSVMPTYQFYGRGFGYTKKLDPALRSAREQISAGIDGIESLDIGAFDAVVVGSLTRNRELTQKMLNKVSPEKLILIHGEDSPPNIFEARWFRSTGANIFVRAIYTS